MNTPNVDAINIWAIQNTSSGEYVEYLGAVPRWGMHPQTWETYEDAVVFFSLFKKGLNEHCRIVPVSSETIPSTT